MRPPELTDVGQVGNLRQIVNRPSVKVAQTFSLWTLLALTALPSQADYNYYATDNLTAAAPSNWTQNYTTNCDSNGFYTNSTSQGARISKVAVPDGTSEYEIKGQKYWAFSQSGFNNGMVTRYEGHSPHPRRPHVGAGYCRGNQDGNQGETRDRLE